MSILKWTAVVLAGGYILASPALAQETISIGHLADYSGATSDVGMPYGQGVADTFEYINENGGINGKKVDIETIDYSYQVPRAIAAYKKWAQRDKVAAIMGWGTADTEALITFVTKDKVPYFSGSYAATLTDPVGDKAERAAPYNFFYGPSYSDAARALVKWAADDWKAKGGEGTPKYVHMGANHPYSNSPKAAAEEYAKELGFEVLPAIQFSLAPADFTAQCLSLKESGADYAFIANTTNSSVSLLKACETVGTDVQFLSNVWGMDEAAAKAAGTAADGVVIPVRTAAVWTDEAPGLAVMKEVAKVSDSSGEQYRPVHYLAGICSALFVRDALKWADENGGIDGENVRKAMYAQADWFPEGTDGVCKPMTWTDTDHRPTAEVSLYQIHVTGQPDNDLNKAIESGAVKMDKIATVELPRRDDWHGH
ncbi:ABC transporter substrate-binding protein [Microbaculum marinum]|uniref:ABC transporter substrate-binding protein n=1 Tax=Microbaculum marinum TaxID=1764581 RepID=A0AAW9S2P8_9HYPH